MKPIEMKVTIGPETAAALGELIRESFTTALPSAIEVTVARAIESALQDQQSETESSAKTGATVTELDRVDARELRSAYLLGKMPDDGSLLIDTKRVANLLNVSPRTVFRLNQEKAMPEPIRIGNKVQWRLREIIEWVEADCPPQQFWRYSEGHGKNTRKR